MFPQAPPADVYVDTNIFVNTLVDGMTQSRTCFAAYEYLVTNQCAIYISELTRLEFLEAMRSLANKSSLPNAFRSEFNLDRWEEPATRRQWLTFWAQKFDEMLSTFQIAYELSYRPTIWRDLPEIMGTTPLRAYDAFHIATALRYDIPEFWTTDADFRRSSGIVVRILANDSF